MTIYIYLLYFIILGTLLSYSHKKKFNDILFWIAAIWTIGIVALRNESIGVDTSTYCYAFLHPTIETTDPGFMLYNIIVRFLTNNKDLYIAITAVLSITPIMYVIWKDSSNKILSLFIFISFGSTLIYYVLYFAAMRQCLAIGLLVLLSHYVRAGKIKSIPLIILLNALIGTVHIIAFIFIPVFLIRKFTFNKKIVCIVLVTSFVIGLNLKQYSQYLIILNGLTSDRFDYYLDYVAESEYMMLATLPMLLLALIITIWGGEEYMKDLYYKTFIIGVVVNNIMELAADSSRLTFMFLITACIAIPNFLPQILSRNAKLIRIGLIFVLLTYYSYKYIGIWDKLDPNANMVPYKTNSLI